MKTIIQEVNQLIGPVNEDEMKIALEIATQDIKGNAIYLGQRTTVKEMVQITVRCVRLYRRCIEQ